MGDIMISLKFRDTIFKVMRDSFNISCQDLIYGYHNDNRTHFRLAYEDRFTSGYFGMNVDFNRRCIDADVINNFSAFAQSDDVQSFSKDFKNRIFLEPFLTSIQRINYSPIIPERTSISVSSDRRSPYKYKLFSGTTFLIDEIVQVKDIKIDYNQYSVFYNNPSKGGSVIAEISIIDSENLVITSYPPKNHANNVSKDFHFKLSNITEANIFFTKLMYLFVLGIDYNDISILDGFDINDKENLYSTLTMFSI